MQRSEGVGNDEASDNEAASEQSDAHSQQRYPHTYELDAMVITLLSRAPGGLTMEDIIDELDSDDDSISNSIERIGDKIKADFENRVLYYSIPQSSDEHELHMDTVGHIFDVILESGPITSEDIHIKVKAVAKSRTYVTTTLRLLVKRGRLMINNGLYHFHFPQDSDEDQGRSSLN